MHTVAEPHPSIASGTYFPMDPVPVRRQVVGHLRDAQAVAPPPPDLEGQAPPKMLVVPHSAYARSGGIAALAYAQVHPWAHLIRRVVLLGPIHREVVMGLALPAITRFISPLGPLRLDAYALARLSAWRGVRVNDGALATEHSLEVQLPFLQVALKEFILLPLGVGCMAPDELAEVLRSVWGGPETLIVVSSDLSNSLPLAEADHRDSHTLRAILGLASDIDTSQACGARVLNGALRAARQHRLQPRLLGRSHSVRDRASPHRVVGHAAIVFSPPVEASKAERH
jgi:MEMO1 family protein